MPAPKAVMALTRVGGPQYEYDVLWTRGTIRITALGRIYRRSEVMKVDHKRPSVTRWYRVRLSYLTAAEYVRRMKQQGWKEVEMKS